MYIYIKVKFVAKSILVARILDILSIPYLLYTCTNFFMGSFNERVLNNIWKNCEIIFFLVSIFFHFLLLILNFSTPIFIILLILILLV